MKKVHFVNCSFHAVIIGWKFINVQLLCLTGRCTHRMLIALILTIGQIVSYSSHHFPITKTAKLSLIIVGRGFGTSGEDAGGGEKFAAGRYILWVLGSIAIVRDPYCVETVSTTTNLRGADSFTTDRVPSPLELNASPVP